TDEVVAMKDAKTRVAKRSEIAVAFELEQAIFVLEPFDVRLVEATHVADERARRLALRVVPSRRIPHREPRKALVLVLEHRHRIERDVRAKKRASLAEHEALVPFLIVLSRSVTACEVSLDLPVATSDRLLELGHGATGKERRELLELVLEAERLREHDVDRDLAIALAKLERRVSIDVGREGRRRLPRNVLEERQGSRHAVGEEPGSTNGREHVLLERVGLELELGAGLDDLPHDPLDRGATRPRVELVRNEEKVVTSDVLGEHHAVPVDDTAATRRKRDVGDVLSRSFAKEALPRVRIDLEHPESRDDEREGDREHDEESFQTRADHVSLPVSTVLGGSRIREAMPWSTANTGQLAARL